MFTVALPAWYVVEDSGAGFVFGTEDFTPTLKTFTAPAPHEWSFEDWEPFYLDASKDGTLTIAGSEVGIETNTSAQIFRAPFGGPESTTMAMLAAVSSTAGVYPGSLALSQFAQFAKALLSAKIEGLWPWWGKILLGITAGLTAAALIRWGVEYRKRKRADNDDIPSPDDPNSDASGSCAKKTCWAEICASSFCCILVGALVGTFVSFGGILWPAAYRNGFALVHEGTFFDKLTICSQWPNPCESQDAQFADGWLTDSAAVAQNVGHYLKKNGVNNETLKLIITQPNDIATGELSIAYEMLQ